MHIVFLCNEYPPAKLVGGIGIFVKNISGALVNAGHNVTVIGLYSQPQDSDSIDENGVRVIRISMRFIPLKLGWLYHRIRYIAAIRKLNIMQPISIIETSDYDAGFFLMPKIKIPKVVRFNGGEVYFRNLLKEKLKWKHRFIETQSAKKADDYCAVSKYAWTNCKQLFNFKSEQMVILPNPIDINLFKPLPGINIDKGSILFSGTFIKKKGVLELAKALNIIFEKIPEAKFIAIGSDSFDMVKNESTRKQALDIIKKEFHNRVQFIDRIENRELPQYLAKAAVCVYPSHLETQGIVIIEAMACEKAVIVTNTGPGPEIVEDGVSGLLCDPFEIEELADKIIKILANEDLAKKLGRIARERVVKNFSMDSLLDKNIEWYQSVISRVKQKNSN